MPGRSIMKYFDKYREANVGDSSALMTEALLWRRERSRLANGLINLGGAVNRAKC